MKACASAGRIARLAVVSAAALLGASFVPAAGAQLAPVLVPLVKPLSEKSGSSPQGLFRRIVTARGFEIDTGRAGLHSVKALGVTSEFTPDTPEIYVVVEFLQSNFDIFRLVGRFILEDPEGKPVGMLLHTDKAQFENEDTGGYLLIRQPPGGFPVGHYRVEIHYEAVTDISLLTLVRFKVVPAAVK
ncbi:MAG: hypothetical protein EPO02_00700 [Nitrospirae bacterium]|nr:MAG: hypothetical protein EPO02_00700 [Nitrospirota bacterium]